METLKWLSSTQDPVRSPALVKVFFSDDQKKENGRWGASETALTKGHHRVPWAVVGCYLLCESVLWVLFLPTKSCWNLPNLPNPKLLISVAQHSEGGKAYLADETGPPQDTFTGLDLTQSPATGFLMLPWQRAQVWAQILVPGKTVGFSQALLLKHALFA